CFGSIPTRSEPFTRTPLFGADSTQASNATCKGVCSIFVRFIYTCAMPYSFTNQPIPFTCFNIPGMRTGSHSRNVETRERNRLVRERIRHRAGVDESHKYRANAFTCGI